MKFYLDTNICIFALKNKFPYLKEKILSHHPENVKIPAIVKAELLLGAKKSNNQAANQEIVEKFLFPFEIKGFNDKESIIYSKIRADLEKEGKVIGPNDLIIASIVLANIGTLVTNNVKEFSRIPGLLIQDWTSNIQ